MTSFIEAKIHLNTTDGSDGNLRRHDHRLGVRPTDLKNHVTWFVSIVNREKTPKDMTQALTDPMFDSVKVPPVKSLDPKVPLLPASRSLANS